MGEWGEEGGRSVGRERDEGWKEGERRGVGGGKEG